MDTSTSNQTDTNKPRPPFPPQDMTPPGLESELTPKPHFHARGYKTACKLQDKVAIITGGDSGIGRAVAYLFAQEGAKVAIICLPEEKPDIKDLQEELNESLFVVYGDVADYEFCERAVDEIVEHYGSVDLLVNNAAVQKHVDAIENLSIEQWQRTFAVNIGGYFNMVKAVIPYLATGAAIINTGSITGIDGNAELLDYASTKGAIHSFTKSLSKMLIKRGIRVNCVSPGPVWTPLNPAERDDKEIKKFGAGTGLGRPAQPEELSPTYVYLASNADSGFVSGEIITVLGG